MVGLVVPKSIGKKTKKGSQSSPLCWQWQAYLHLEAQGKKKEKRGSQSFVVVGDGGEQSSPISIGNGRPSHA
jgi:hypothetical protein